MIVLRLEVRKNEDKIWRRNGEVHRDLLPAVILKDGALGWWQNGRIIRAN